PVRSWDGKTPPDRDVLDLLNRAGTDLVPAVDSPEGRAMKLWEREGAVTVEPGVTVPVTRLVAESPQQLRALHLSVPRKDAIAFGRTKLRITWDDTAFP